MIRTYSIVSVITFCMKYTFFVISYEIYVILKPFEAVKSGKSYSQLCYPESICMHDYMLYYVIMVFILS